MGHLKLILAFFALCIMSAGVFAAAYFYKHFIEPEREIVREIEHVKEVPKSERPAPPDLGIRQFAKAVDLLEEGELIAAREQLYYLMQYYPDSATFADAKRIVGEINVDLLLSEIPIEGKSEYVIKSGDALSRIARNNNCTINYIMRVSGRTTSTASIQVGERLTVYPLDQFSMVIDQSDRTIRVEWQGRLLKEYTVTKFALPPMVRVPASAEITSISAWNDKGSLGIDDVEYFGATKGISTSKPGLMISASPQAVSLSTPVASAQKETGGGGGSAVATASSTGGAYGIMVAPEDMEEMFSYLRPGTPVRLVE